MQYLERLYNRIKNFTSMYITMRDVNMTGIDSIERLIISVLFYQVLIWIKSTRAWNLFKGILTILLFVLVAAIFRMTTILWLAEKTVNVGLIALVIIFQPELRNALSNLGDKNILGKFFSIGKNHEAKYSDKTID